jgi:hypothetical protein
MRSTSWWFGLLGGALLLGCGDDGGTPGGGQDYTTRSSVSDGYGGLGAIITAPGPGVSGLYPGEGPNNLEDGWSVDYQKLLVAVGTVTLRGTDRGDVEFVANRVVDLQGLPPVGSSLGGVDINSRPTAVDFTLERADDRFVPLEPYTSGDDAELMAKGGYAVYIEGTIEKDDGRSCQPGTSVCVDRPTIRFRWGIPADFVYEGCERDPSDGDQSVKLTFPALHWLRANFDPDDDSDLLLAQWIANADLDGDGETTTAELQQIPAASLFTQRRGYELSGTERPIATAYDFLREQVRAMGLRSWGRCQSTANI